MTPKEKANDLYASFYTAIQEEHKSIDPHFAAKQCAAIAAGEIMRAGDVDELYWNQVKIEIEKL